MLFPTLFIDVILLAGPKHSTSVSFSAKVALPLSADKKEVAFVPNSVPALAVNLSPVPQIEVEVDLCNRLHSSLVLIPTLQVVIPLMSPVTLQLKVKVLPGQVGGAAKKCLVTTPGRKYSYISTNLTPLKVIVTVHILPLTNRK